MMPPPVPYDNNGFSFSARRVHCPACGARRGFAPLSGHTEAGKCFACNVFIAPSALENRGGVSSWLQGDITRAQRQPERTLIDARPARIWSKVPTATTYDYHDEEGATLYHVDRKERHALYRYPDGSEQWEREKTFVQRPAGAEQASTGCMEGVRRVLYRLPCVLQAIRHEWPVVIVEGEKDADTYNDLFREELAYDARATCCPGGAGKWLTYGPGYGNSLRGADIILDGDMDPPGLRHVLTVANALHGIARRIRIMPELFSAIREGVR